MNVDAKIYNDTNTLQLRDGLALIDKIKASSNEKSYDIALEIGSGSGNLSAIFKRELNIGTYIGCDVDPGMVAYAQLNNPGNINNNDPGITYIIENFGQPWDSLCPDIKRLEGRVNLIISNQTLHWISDRRPAVANNIRRLLTTDDQSRAYLQFVVISGYKDVLQSAMVKYFISKMLKTGLVRELESVEQQRSRWLDAFIAHGITPIVDTINSLAFTYTELEYYLYAVPLGINYFLKRDNRILKRVLQKSARWIKSKRVNTRVDVTTGEKLFDVTYENFLFILRV